MATEFWHSSKLLYEEDTEGHHDTACCNIRLLPFPNSGTLPKYTQQPSFISVQETGYQGSDISTGTYKQQDYSQQTLKIEDGRHSEAGEASPTSFHCFFFFLKGTLFIYLFLAVLGLRFCARAFSSCGKRGPLFIAVRGSLTVAASLVAEHRLQRRRLSSCGSRAQLLRGMWDLPRPGLEPVCPALAGRFSTTVPPGKPLSIAS